VTGRRFCAHADQDGEGAHWLEPGEDCPAAKLARVRALQAEINRPEYDQARAFIAGDNGPDVLVAMAPGELPVSLRQWCREQIERGRS
jgi:hypothetical protein